VSKWKVKTIFSTHQKQFDETNLTDTDSHILRQIYATGCGSAGRRIPSAYQD